MAKTEKTWIRKLVDRLCALPAQDVSQFVPASVVRDELGRAIDRFCANEDHATRTVDALVYNPDVEKTVFRPTPLDVKLAAESTPIEVSKLQSASANCPHCSGTGWKIIERGRYSGAEVCECRKGAAA